MNWIGKLLGFRDTPVTDVEKVLEESKQEAKELFSDKVSPNKNISEPVHMIVKNMLEHPSRWKVRAKANNSAYTIRTDYTVKDIKTGEEFRAKRSYGLSSVGVTNERLDVYVQWITDDEANLFEETLNRVWKIKKDRKSRLAKYKQSKERARLLEIYK